MKLKHLSIRVIPLVFLFSLIFFAYFTIQYGQIWELTARRPGKIWLIPPLLALLWLALYFNKRRSVILASIISLILAVLMGPPFLEVGLYSQRVFDPIVFAIFGGIAGGLIGGALPNSSKISWDLIVMIIGFTVGFGLGYFCVILLAMATS